VKIGGGTTPGQRQHCPRRNKTGNNRRRRVLIATRDGDSLRELSFKLLHHCVSANMNHLRTTALLRHAHCSTDRVDKALLLLFPAAAELAARADGRLP
jgi:hypothetical protein